VLFCAHHNTRLLGSLCLSSAGERQSTRVWSASLAKAREFVDALCRSIAPDPHYMGSSGQHMPTARIPSCGQASARRWVRKRMVWVDANVPVEVQQWISLRLALCATMAKPALQSMAMVHPSLYPMYGRAYGNDGMRRKQSFLIADVDGDHCLTRRYSQVVPATNRAEWRSYLLRGGERRQSLLPHFEHPSIAQFACAWRMFGSGLWIAAGTRDEFSHGGPIIRIHCAACCCRCHWWLSRLPNVARLVINGDPSVEYIF